MSLGPDKPHTSDRVRFLTIGQEPLDKSSVVTNTIMYDGKEAHYTPYQHTTHNVIVVAVLY
jgi:hypothetical protein